ncbi:MAG: hypothetical protein CL927_15750 [Deltaproteobacteria bacterium]|nr:hypothetical protein [Deltaproteobacteria bacterium]
MTRFQLSAALLLTLAMGCEDGKTDSGATVNPCTADESNGGWPASVQPACVGQDIIVSLGSGAAIDLDWADESDVACFPGTENLNFDGNHVFFWFAQPESSILTVTATPKSGVDSSVYVIQSANRYEVPPGVVSAVACEAGYDAQTDSNPGEADDAIVTATTNPYDILIGVAGAGGTTSGAVTLSLSLEQ